ncbi:hypothetical protein [Longispora albida]|uniref:hypothetical protein n=1 Tax=Longispora albida TaxID=203523 RepID=UPI00039B7321|nr:hypothetical protein [Longispora albida]
MSGQSLTQRYLAAVAERGLTAGELLPAEAYPSLLMTVSSGRCAPMPAFISHAELSQLHGDLTNMHAALESLPAKAFGGDFAAFARAVGLSPLQVEFAVRTQAGQPLTKFSRADFYADASGFKILEYNVGTQIGCLEQGLQVDGALRHPLLAEFAAANNLGHVDTIAEQITTMLAETGTPRAGRPVIGLVDWPGEFTGVQQQAIRESAEHHTATLGVESLAGHLGELEYHDGRVWLHGRPLDVIYRIFMLQHVNEPEGPALMEPLIAAAERGEVKIFAPIGCEAFAAKAALALLSDEDNRKLFTAEERASLDRILPWTRITNPGQVTTPAGVKADLLEYALANREELALKPTLLHGGAGVVLGWERTDAEWREAVASSMDGGSILQHRVRPLHHAMPGPDGELIEYIFNWGIFSVAPNGWGANGYGGLAIRCAPVQANVGVVGRLSAAQGALFGGTMHELG